MAKRSGEQRRWLEFWLAKKKNGVLRLQLKEEENDTKIPEKNKKSESSSRLHALKVDKVSWDKGPKGGTAQAWLEGDDQKKERGGQSPKKQGGPENLYKWGVGVLGASRKRRTDYIRGIQKPKGKKKKRETKDLCTGPLSANPQTLPRG